MINVNRGLQLPRPSIPLESGYWNAAVPPVCVVPLQQHVGSVLEPLVSVGDIVREGMVIATGVDRLAVPLHAPVPGVVTQIGTMTLVDGSRSGAIVIELSGEFDRLGKTLERHRWEHLGPNALLSLVQEAGVVCSDGTGLPAHIALRRYMDIPKTRVVLDVAQNEPYVGSDAEIALQEPDLIFEGLAVVSRIVGATEVQVIVSRRYSSVLRALRRAASKSRAATNNRIDGDRIVFPTVRTRVKAVRDRYPAYVPRPHTDGTDAVYYVGPATIRAVYEAVVLRKPVIDRVVAVSGGAVMRPAHVRVRIGTSIANVLHECGGLRVEPAVIIMGGALTGYPVTNVETPITKLSSSIVALTPDELHTQPERTCIGCGACERVCPAELDPVVLYYLVRDGLIGQACDAGLTHCVECGLCSYVCPSRLPLATSIVSTAHRRRRPVGATVGARGE